MRTINVLAPSTSLVEKLERKEIDVLAVLQPVQKCLPLPPGTKTTQPIKIARPAVLLLQDLEGGDVFVSLLWTSWGAKLVTTLLLCVAAFRLSSTVHWWLRPDHHAWTVSDIMLWAIAAIAQQGYTKHPKGLSCRAMFALGYLMANLMYTAFAAAVCSLLASSAEAPEGKLQQPVNWDSLTANKKIIADASLAPLLYVSKQLTEPAVDTETAVRLLLSKQTNYALSVDVAAARILNSASLGSDACRLRVAPLKGSTLPLPTFLPYSLVISRYSDAATALETWLVRLRESGIGKRLEDSKNLPCDHALGGGFQSAGLRHVGSAMFIYLTGVMSAMIILFLEIATASRWFDNLVCGLIKREKKKKTQKVDKDDNYLPWPVLA